MIGATLKRFRQDERGVAIIEFAYAAPIWITLVMVTFDLGHRTYVSNILTGEVQKAARDATLETGASTTAAAAFDNRVKTQTNRVLDENTWSFSRRFYPSFTRAGQQENFTDGNTNSRRDAGECFQDENGNGVWDAVGGRAGGGGADDIVQYTATVTYPRLFPLYGILGWSQNQTVSATSVLRNQPYGAQTTTAPVTVCT